MQTMTDIYRDRDRDKLTDRYCKQTDRKTDRNINGQTTTMESEQRDKKTD